MQPRGLYIFGGLSRLVGDSEICTAELSVPEVVVEKVVVGLDEERTWQTNKGKSTIIFYAPCTCSYAALEVSE